MARTYRRQPFGLLLTTGDNVYYGDVTDRVEDVVAKPYKPLFDAGVEFRPSLGNHDLEDENGVAAILAALGLPGRYYHFAQGPVGFFALDSNQLDGDQLKWLAKGLNCSESEWQVVYLHHPQYSSGANGSDIELRTILEPILVAGGADIVFAGHDHNYERTTPQRGIVYVVTGGGSRTRSVGSSDFTAVSEKELHFLLATVSGGRMSVEAIDADGNVIDTFSLNPRPAIATCGAGAANASLNN